MSSRRFPVRAVGVRPRASCACAAGCGCACAAVPLPLLLLGCCCRTAAASSDDVLIRVGEDDEATCTEGAATEDLDATAGAVSSEDIAMLLLLKLKSVSFSLMVKPKQIYTADNLFIPKSGRYGDLLGGLSCCRCNRRGCKWVAVGKGALPAAHRFASEYCCGDACIRRAETAK